MESKQSGAVPCKHAIPEIPEQSWKKNKNTGTFTKLWFLIFFYILIKGWLKFQSGGEMANILNMRSGHAFVGGHNCGGSAGSDALW